MSWSEPTYGAIGEEAHKRLRALPISCVATSAPPAPTGSGWPTSLDRQRSLPLRALTAMAYIVIYDACVLHEPALRDVLIRLATKRQLNLRA